MLRQMQDARLGRLALGDVGVAHHGAAERRGVALHLDDLAVRAARFR